MKPHVISAVTSGLGNQMFQYAAGRALSHRLGLPLLLDLSWYGGGHGFTPREYGLRVFSLPAKIATREQLIALQNNDLNRQLGLVPLSELFTFVRERGNIYWPAFHSFTGPTYMRGWWQSARYFEAVRAVIRGDFTFPELTSPRARELAAEISETTNSVSVHIRRGDYVSHPFVAKTRGIVCSPQYYAAAINKIAEANGALKLFLFSEDAAWVRANFDAQGHAATVVDVPEHLSEPHHDIHLMSLARHHIIANSTFSWWGAWLGPEGERMVISPKRWIIDKTEVDFARRARIPPSWITL